MDFEDIMLNEISQKKTNDLTYMYSLKKKVNKQNKAQLINIENRLVVAKDEEWEVVQMSEGGQKVQKSSVKKKKRKKKKRD